MKTSTQEILEGLAADRRRRAAEELIQRSDRYRLLDSVGLATFRDQVSLLHATREYDAASQLAAEVAAP